MASIIRIKRSTTAGDPSTLGAGELAYSAADSSVIAGGDRLYIGSGSETAGNAASHIVIGGKFFTDMLDHAKGTLTANSAIIVDSNKKIDELNVDNLTLNGNTISSTDTNGNILIDPEGLGHVEIVGTNGIVIPKGTTQQRGPSLQAAIRYNTDISAFEGYSGTNWSSLGGVKSVDGKTFISAELNPGDSDDTIRFVTDDVVRMALDTDSLDIGSTISTVNIDATTASTTTSTGALVVDGGVGIAGQATINNIKVTATTASTSTSTGALTVAGGVGIAGDLYVAGAISAESATFASINNTPIGNLTPSTGAFTVLDVDNIRIDGNAITSTNTDGNITITPNGTGKSIISNIYTDTNTSLTEFIQDVTGGQIVAGNLIDVTYNDGAGTTTIDVEGSVVSSVTTDTGVMTPSNNAFSILGGEGVDITHSGSTITVAGEDASASNKGIASFNSDDFDITAGAVDLKGTVVKTVTTDSGALTPSTHGFSVLGGEGIDVTHTGTTITVTGELASTSNIGVASFASADFDVSIGGEVTIKTAGVGNSQLENSSVTVGSTTIALGATSTSLAGLTEVTVDNLKIDGNEISSINTNGNISLNPNGTGTVDVNSSRITGLLDPVDPQDAATKAYVDARAAGLDPKQSVRAATTAPITLSNTQTIDGIALSVGDRVLVKDQTNNVENGIYVVASGAWSRSTDMDEPSELTAGLFFFVESGTVNGDAGFVKTSDSVGTVGTDPITFVQFSGAGQIIAGAGLTKTGNQLDVVVAASGGIEISADELQLKSTVAGAGLTYTNGVLDVVGTADRITINTDSIDIASTYVGQTSITTLGTIATGTWQGSIISPTYGGTGVNNGNKTITLGGNLQTSGSSDLILTTTGSTNVTLPTTGTLATLAGTESLSNKTITSSSFSGTTISASGLIDFTNSTDATSLTSAAVTMAGGLAVSKKLYVGSNLVGAGASVSSLSGFNIDGGTY
jgi:hypothetical protein